MQIQNTDTRSLTYKYKYKKLEIQIQIADKIILYLRRRSYLEILEHSGEQSVTLCQTSTLLVQGSIDEKYPDSSP